MHHKLKSRVTLNYIKVNTTGWKVFQHLVVLRTVQNDFRLLYGNDYVGLVTVLLTQHYCKMNEDWNIINYSQYTDN